MYRPPSMPGAEKQLNGAYATQLPGAESNSSTSRQLVHLTLFALKNETIYGATDYWIDDGRLDYVLSDGTQRTADLSDIDWGRTTQLNSERGVRVALRTGRDVY